MSNLLFVGRRVQTGFLCCMLLFLCVSTAVGDPKPLSKEEQAKVDRAIDKGVAFLKKSQRKGGVWPCKKFRDLFPIGQCALPAYSLLESGVAADDPVIQRATVFLRHNALRTTWTYEISLALLFFDRLGDAKDKKLIQSLALRLIAGQFRSGGWSYQNYALTEKQETTLLALLEELNKRMETTGKSRAEALEEIDVPRKYRTLTVFQESRKLNWVDLQGSPGDKNSLPLVGMTDNSNTQFALLGLWAGQRHGVPLNATFGLAVERFERSQSASSGQWAYSFGTNPRPGRFPGASMTCVGLLGLAIGRGTKLPTPGSPALGREDLRVLGGLTALYQDIGIPTGSMDNQLPLQDVYFLWSVERVAMLYNLPTVGDKEWYRWGAEILVTNQMGDGSWPGIPRFVPENSMVKPDYGPMLNTAFALLFLKRAHPMKDLTPKLPFTAKELNEGIACLRRGEKLPERPAAIVSPNKKVEP